MMLKVDKVVAQSVFTWNGSCWTVVGVHGCSGHPNSATRFTTEMIFRFLRRMNWIIVNYPNRVAVFERGAYSKF